VRRLSRFAHALDYGTVEDWLDCFTVDGVWEVRGREPHHPQLRLVGRDELSTFFVRRVRPAHTANKHTSLEPLVTLEGDAAMCLSFQAVIVAGDRDPVFGYLGRHRDRLVKEGDGSWRLRERTTDLASMNPTLAHPPTDEASTE
jgi:hypothetical protein